MAHLLRHWLVPDDLGYISQEGAETRTFRFEVPNEEWSDALMPARGAATPASLGGIGIVLNRQAHYRALPGHVVCILTCGITPELYDGATVGTWKEQINGRRYFRRYGESFSVRVYDAPIDTALTLPLDGAYFPGETSGPKIARGGVEVHPVVGHDGTRKHRITITARVPILVAGNAESYPVGS